MKISKYILIAIVISLAGCNASNPKKNNVASNNEVTYSGKSHASSRLKKDALKTIKVVVGAKGCNKIDHINSKIFHYEPSNGKKGHVWGKEGWLVTGCSKPYPFYLTFTEDGKGGTFFSIKTKK